MYAHTRRLPTHTVRHSNRYQLLCLFTALCVFLAMVEYAVPKPLPFLRLGLANLPILLSLELLRRRDTIALVVLKVVAQSIVGGTLFSYLFLFSLSSSVASGAVMLSLHILFARRRLISAVGLSVAGALASATAQLALAHWLLFGKSVRYIAPLLCTAATVSGATLGVFCERFKQKSAWYAALVRRTPHDTAQAATVATHERAATDNARRTATVAANAATVKTTAIATTNMSDNDGMAIIVAAAQSNSTTNGIATFVAGIGGANAE